MPGKKKPLRGNAAAVAQGVILRGAGGRAPQVTSRSYGLRTRNNGKAAPRDTSWPAGNVRRVVVRSKEDPEPSKASSSSSASSEVEAEAEANVDEPRDSPSVAGKTDELHGAVPKAVAKEVPKAVAKEAPEPSDQPEQDDERVAGPAETGPLLPERSTLPAEADSETDSLPEADAGTRAGARAAAKVDSEDEEARLVLTADPAVEALPGISESWTREMRWEGLSLRLFRAHPDRWYIAFRPQLRAFLPTATRMQGRQLRRTGRLPLTVLDELRRLDRRQRLRYTGVAAEDFARELATDALRRSWEAALGALQQGVPPPEAGRLEPRPTVGLAGLAGPAARAGAGALVAAPPARGAEAAEALPGAAAAARRSARLRERRRLGREEARAAELLGAPAPKKEAAAGARACYPCLLAGVPCHGRISYRGVRLACNFCRAAGLSQRQCALPPKASSGAAPTRAAKCHYCRDPCISLPLTKSGIDPTRTCAACGLLVCGRAGCRRAARVQEHLPYFVCCHCLGVPQECGCPDGQSLLRRLLLHGPLSTKAPLRLRHHSEHLAPMEPAVCQRLPREVRWLFLSASRRPWLRMEHQHFIFELRRLRAQVEKLRGRDAAAHFVLDRWLRAGVWPPQVLAKHLVALKGGPPPPALSDQSLGWCPWPPQRKRPFRARARRRGRRAKAARAGASEDDAFSLSSGSLAGLGGSSSAPSSSSSSSSSEAEAGGGSSSSSSSSSSGPAASPSGAGDSD